VAVVGVADTAAEATPAVAYVLSPRIDQFKEPTNELSVSDAVLVVIANSDVIIVLDAWTWMSGCGLGLDAVCEGDDDCLRWRF
jgi:hypothetical protein